LFIIVEKHKIKFKGQEEILIFDDEYHLQIDDDDEFDFALELIERYGINEWNFRLMLKIFKSFSKV
jgi:hypothetical protein